MDWESAEWGTKISVRLAEISVSSTGRYSRRNEKMETPIFVTSGPFSSSLPGP